MSREWLSHHIHRPCPHSRGPNYILLLPKSFLSSSFTLPPLLPPPTPPPLPTTIPVILHQGVCIFRRLCWLPISEPCTPFFCLIKCQYCSGVSTLLYIAMFFRKHCSQCQYQRGKSSWWFHLPHQWLVEEECVLQFWPMREGNSDEKSGKGSSRWWEQTKGRCHHWIFANR